MTMMTVVTMMTDGAMSLDALSSTSGSVASTSTMGISNLTIGNLPPSTTPISIKTSTFTRFPHLFLSIMYNVLAEMETMNAADPQLPQVNNQAMNRNWSHHQLSSLSDWKYLNHRQRSKLDYLRNLAPQSLQYLANLLTTTQQQIQDGTFVSPLYLALPKLRLFSILPVPTLTRKFIQVPHESLSEIMRHFGLGHERRVSDRSTKGNDPHDGRLFQQRQLLLSSSCFNRPTTKFVQEVVSGR